MSALLLSVLGLWISFYFTGVSYRWFSPNVWWIPSVCRLKETSCQLVIHTPRAKLFGIPNSVFGIGLYSYLILYLLGVKIGDRLPVHFEPVTCPLFLGVPLAWVLGFGATGLAVLRSVYLAYSLIFVTRVACPLCFTSHVINLILFIYLWTIR